MTVDSPPGTHISNTASRSVNAEVEFPDGTLRSMVGGDYIIGASIDVQASKVQVSYTQNSLAGTSSFNGYVIRLPDSGPSIAKAQLDPSSSFSSTQVGVSSSAKEVDINVSGLQVRRGDLILVNLDLVKSFGAEPAPRRTESEQPVAAGRARP